MTEAASDDARREARERTRAMWSRGDYPSVGERLREASGELAHAAQVMGGDRVLDVGCGAGHTSVALAQRGADVVGIDLTDAWFDSAHERARDGGVEVDLRVADAEEMPFDDASFDVVASCFAHIFAPRHDVVAAEMARVLRPGGTLAVAVWDDRPEPSFDAIQKWLPTPPPDLERPRAWGDPDHLRAKFHPVGIKLDRVDVHDLDWEFPSRDAMIEWLFTASGPWIATRELLETAGAWEQARRALEAAVDEHDVREDGTCLHRMRYRIAVGQRIG